MTIKLFGIKNDTHHRGYEVTIPPASNGMVDPISCLRAYIDRTPLERQLTPDKPLFLTLNKPYKGMAASTIAEQLSQWITLAGLGGSGYSAKSFGPAASTLTPGGVFP